MSSICDADDGAAALAGRGYADAVGFPENILTDDETVAMHLHPHWREMVLPVLTLLVAIAGVVAGYLFLPEGTTGNILLLAIGAVALILVLWRVFWPWMKWRMTHYLFTNERVVLQFGIFHRERRDIPLHRINDHTMNQSLVDRMYGCGTLTIESAGERGQTNLRDVPKVQRVQTLLYDLVDKDRDKHALGDDEMREIMEDLHRGSDSEK
jgi:uncharacterized membrane protein YdbT with pleckstrin-like domain